jgi:hypothetical protein
MVMSDDRPSDTLEFGTDNEGRTHAYSRMENMVYVSNGETYALRETPFSTPGEWAEHVRGTCGWRELRLTNGNGLDSLASRLQSSVQTGRRP